jgi:protein-arginine kinase activator protein McsA
VTKHLSCYVCQTSPDETVYRPMTTNDGEHVHVCSHCLGVVMLLQAALST